MSLPTFLKVLPAAFIALGTVAAVTSAANSSPLAENNAVSAAADVDTHADAWGMTKLKVGTKKRRKKARRSNDRFSGFGFRGDGFRTSGQYN